jgi:DNA-binding FrmR family transcriptional regulator
LSEHEHSHTAPDGTVYTHTHEHQHTQTKAVLNRLSRAIGHLESVKKMVENGRDCSEVLIQLAAVRSALNNTAKVILKDHIEHCLVDAIKRRHRADRQPEPKRYGNFDRNPDNRRPAGHVPAGFCSL